MSVKSNNLKFENICSECSTEPTFIIIVRMVQLFICTSSPSLVKPIWYSQNISRTGKVSSGCHGNAASD